MSSQSWHTPLLVCLTEATSAEGKAYSSVEGLKCVTYCFTAGPS